MLCVKQVKYLQNGSKHKEGYNQSLDERQSTIKHQAIPQQNLGTSIIASDPESLLGYRSKPRTVNQKEKIAFLPYQQTSSPFCLS